MASDAYLKLEGIKGESIQPNHTGEIEVQAFQFGANNMADVVTGTGAGTGSANLSGLSVMKKFDAASAELFQSCCQGKHFDKATLSVYKAAGDKALKYITFDMENVFVDNINWSGSDGGGIPMENLGIVFSKILVTYVEQKPDGSAGGNHTGSWDLRVKEK